MKVAGRGYAGACEGNVGGLIARRERIAPRDGDKTGILDTLDRATVKGA